MKKIISLLILGILFQQTVCLSESVLKFDDIAIKDEQTQEYQLMYLAGQCITHLERKNTYENIVRCRSIYNQVKTPIKETISYWLSDSQKYICLIEEISFNNNVTVHFESDYIEFSNLRRYLMPSTATTSSSSEYLSITTDNGVNFILLQDFIKCFDNIQTVQASLILRSPYISEDLNDVHIPRFSRTTSLVDGNNIYLPEIDDFDEWTEYLNEDKNLPWNQGD